MAFFARVCVCACVLEKVEEEEEERRGFNSQEAKEEEEDVEHSELGSMRCK